jgi:hypothetical protein
MTTSTIKRNLQKKADVKHYKALAVIKIAVECGAGIGVIEYFCKWVVEFLLLKNT